MFIQIENTDTCWYIWVQEFKDTRRSMTMANQKPAIRYRSTACLFVNTSLMVSIKLIGKVENPVSECCVNYLRKGNGLNSVGNHCDICIFICLHIFLKMLFKL